MVGIVMVDWTRGIDWRAILEVDRAAYVMAAEGWERRGPAAAPAARVSPHGAKGTPRKLFALRCGLVLYWDEDRWYFLNG